VYLRRGSDSSSSLSSDDDDDDDESSDDDEDATSSLSSATFLSFDETSSVVDSLLDDWSSSVLSSSSSLHDISTISYSLLSYSCPSSYDIYSGLSSSVVVVVVSSVSPLLRDFPYMLLGDDAADDEVVFGVESDVDRQDGELLPAAGELAAGDCGDDLRVVCRNFGCFDVEGVVGCSAIDERNVGVSAA